MKRLPWTDTREQRRQRDTALRRQGYSDGYAHRPARSTLLEYQRAYIRGVNARHAAAEHGGASYLSGVNQRNEEATRDAQEL